MLRHCPGAVSTPGGLAGRLKSQPNWAQTELCRFAKRGGHTLGVARDDAIEWSRTRGKTKPLLDVRLGATCDGPRCQISDRSRIRQQTAADPSSSNRLAPIAAIWSALSPLAGAFQISFSEAIRLL